MKKLYSLIFGMILLSATQVSTAAIVTIDDSDIDDLTFTWSGFIDFSIGATTYAGAGTATLVDTIAGYNFGGFYSVADIIDESFDFELGAEAGAPGDITSEVGFFIDDASAIVGPGVAFLGGSVSPYVNGHVYGSGLTSFVQGDSVTLNGSDLTLTFISEASDNVVNVPAPASLLIFGLALLGMGLRRNAKI